MRVIAKVQLTTSGHQDAIGEKAIAAVARWADRKFTVAPDGAVRIRKGGQNAQWDSRSAQVGDDRLDAMCMLEPVDGGHLQMEVEVLTEAARVAVRCVLKVESDAGVAPADVPVRPPRFLREIVGLPCQWTVGVGGERVFAQPFFVGADELLVLEALLVSERRRLPVIVVSEHDGETLAGDVHEKIAHDLCGLAHVVRLSTEASWALTRKLGREWSCYNGAVRLFWPFRSQFGEARAHPLWTYDQLGARFATEPEAREHLRAVLARRVLEASTFVADDPGFGSFTVARAAAAAQAARATAEEGGDFRQLAHVYAEENDRLRRAADDQRRLIEELRAQVELLETQLRSGVADAADADDRGPPETVVEAVEIARRELAGRVVIAAETDDDLHALKPVAGPPEKILRYLRALGDLADAMAQGPINRAVPIWLRDRNVECSVDSETTKLSDRGRRFRLRKVDGEVVDCQFHLKPADKVRPDMCARIYFATDPAQAPHVKVGYIGRHID